VGISDPIATGRLLDTVTLTAGAVATSGSAERGAHIWDPLRDKAARDVLSLSVVAKDIVRADVMATAGIARGADACDWLDRVAGVEALAVLADGTVTTTRAWGGSATLAP
jgi:thiamine biosynthesis lipoprotein